jgi:heme/copper-type cytochrome/quinol oxidase subunit 3
VNRTLDVSGLPSYRFSHHSLMWWGVVAMMAIEGTVFAMALATYFYLWSQAESWPLSAPPPELKWGTLNVIVLLASAWPNQWSKRAGEECNERKVKIGLVIGTLFGIALIAVRALEFTTLNVRWDTNAYGSMVWMLLGLHTTHLVTDVYDTVVLAVLFFTGPVEGKRYVDVSENSLYWYFVVLTWLPIYAVIYWAPRWL